MPIAEFKGFDNPYRECSKSHFGKVYKMTIIPLLLISVCLIASSCTYQSEAVTVDAHKVIYPILEDVSYSNKYVAQIQSVSYVEIRSKIRGYIEKIYVDEGQPVKKGQLLFALSSSVFDKELQKANAAYKSAAADLKVAQVELANVTILLEKNIVSESELHVIQAKVDALNADVEEAVANEEQVALNLSFSKIKAPYDGFINRIPNKVGSLIAEGDMLTSLSDDREVFAYFHLSEIDYLKYLAAGERETKVVGLELANHVLYGHEGTIEMIESEFDESTGNIGLRARFPNPEGLLKQGANGKVIVNKTLKSALLIPQKSTFEIQDKLYVYVVNHENVLEQRNMVYKMRLPKFYVVESGLSKDEKILFEGVENVMNGDSVYPVHVENYHSMM
ncbi:MAG: efflux RND transporter periplasmic adaptor subunit [Nitrospirales bacterium]|nr:efflux RND transporter periplasmic adaptor subunit [Nitrospirales bacterium]